MPIYWSSKQVPELAELTPSQRREVHRTCYLRHRLPSRRWILGIAVIAFALEYRPPCGGASMACSAFPCRAGLRPLRLVWEFVRAPSSECRCSRCICGHSVRIMSKQSNSETWRNLAPAEVGISLTPRSGSACPAAPEERCSPS